MTEWLAQNHSSPATDYMEAGEERALLAFIKTVSGYADDARTDDTFLPDPDDLDAIEADARDAQTALLTLRARTDSWVPSE